MKNLGYVEEEFEVLRFIAKQARVRSEPVALKDVEDGLLDLVPNRDGNVLEKVLDQLEEEGYIERRTVVKDYAGVPSEKECVVLTRPGGDVSGEFSDGLIRGRFVRRWTCPECDNSVWLGEIGHNFVLCDCCEGMPYMEPVRMTLDENNVREI